MWSHLEHLVNQFSILPGNDLFKINALDRAGKQDGDEEHQDREFPATHGLDFISGMSARRRVCRDPPAGGPARPERGASEQETGIQSSTAPARGIAPLLIRIGGGDRLPAGSHHSRLRVHAAVLPGETRRHVLCGRRALRVVQTRRTN